MTLLDREVIPPTISARGILYSGFLLVLVVSLFFIPEIVRFQESWSTPGKSASSTPAVQSSTINIEDIIPSGGAPGSLDQILSLVTGDAPAETATDRLTITIPEVTASKETDQKSPDKTLKAIQDKVLLERTLGGGTVTWGQLTSSSVKKAFKNAQSNAGKILKGLNSRQSAVRFALINYINGLGWITRGDKKIMSAEEALAYIEQLDINVTQAMLNSETDTADFEAWKRISFGPLSVSSRASAFKMGNTITFNPRMTLTSIEIQRGADWVMKKRAAVRRIPRSALRVTGFVIGKDVRRIVISRNGRRLSEIKVGRSQNEDGLRVFRWRSRTAEGLFTFRAVSKGGDVYEKSYAFLPKVFGRFRQDADGYYLLPFGMSGERDVSLRDLDARLDRFFRVGNRSTDDGASPNRGFETF